MPGCRTSPGSCTTRATDRYDVLRSNPELLATDQRIAAAEFDLLMQVAARYYRLVIFDSGNDESAERWLRMVDNSYQLVIPTLATPESAESAVLLLDALRGRDERSAALADHAVVDRDPVRTDRRGGGPADRGRVPPARPRGRSHPVRPGPESRASSASTPSDPAPATRGSASPPPPPRPL